MRELYGMDRWRELKLPEYDWEPVRNVLLPNLLNELAQDQSPICNDVTTAGMLECFQIRIKDVVNGRIEEARRGLPFNLRTVLDPTPYVATLIAQIRSDSRPFAFTEEQLLENPNSYMLPDQLHLTRVYHRLVVETLKTLDMMIRSHFDARQYQEHLRKALAEVARATKTHKNLESKYEKIIQITLIEGIDWQENVNLSAYELAPADSMQSPPEDQNYAYYYEPISDHGFGYGLEASTSQPRPQRGFIDFLGVEDTTREATPELAPRWGHSHDDRDPHTDNRFGNEQHRPPSGH
ncbi:hypothetical protein SeLEV6574_g08621, partial [Synchytrium endobioticum]